MQNKVFIGKSDKCVIFEKTTNLYWITLRQGNFVLDKMRCDNYRLAHGYYRAFKAIAKAQ